VLSLETPVLLESTMTSSASLNLLLGEVSARWDRAERGSFPMFMSSSSLLASLLVHLKGGLRQLERPASTSATLLADQEKGRM
jgi:hypothetical protein